MKRYSVIDKKVGDTPLQALESFRRETPELSGLSLTYAGRLDPLASGKLLILIGDECKKRKAYDGLDKEYEFEALFGFKSDTGDVLGLAKSCVANGEYYGKKMQALARSFVGPQSLPYPAFSSKVVSGKPLFHHAVLNNLEKIIIPGVNVQIHKMVFLGARTVSKDKLLENILTKINMLNAGPITSKTGSGFRKDEIISQWKKLQTSNEQYTIAKFKTTVSSGTYIRALVPLMAEKLGTCGLAYSIHRTKIGRYFPFAKKFGFWLKTF